MAKRTRYVALVALTTALFALMYLSTRFIGTKPPRYRNVAQFNEKSLAFKEKCESLGLPNIEEVSVDEPSLYHVLEKFSSFYVEHKVLNRDRADARYEVFSAALEEFSEFSDFSDSQPFVYKFPLLVATNVLDSGSFGHESSGLKDFMKVIQRLKYPKSKVHLAISVKSKDEFDKFCEIVRQYYQQDLAEFYKGLEDKEWEMQTRTKDFGDKKLSRLHKISVLHAPFVENANSVQFNREDRHKDALQRERRATIAKARNVLVNTLLGTEKYVLFVDSDIVYVPSEFVNHGIKHDVDVLVPRIKKGGCYDYDQNSWIGERRSPSRGDLRAMNAQKSFDNAPDDNLGFGDDYKVAKFDESTPGPSSANEFVFVPNRGSKSWLLEGFTRNLEFNSEMAYNHLVEVDSVGGAILFAKSVMFKQGLQFPPLYVVGTSWNRNEGFDGIETEGLCWEARSLGYRCWGMPDVLGEHYDS